MRTVLFRLLLRFSLLIIGIVAWTGQATAQENLLITFPEVPCDSVACDSLIISNADTVAKRLTEIRFRDGLGYSVGPELILPDTIFPAGSLAVPVCFRPHRRGTISDSLYIVIESESGVDTLKARLTGQGVGPRLSADPSVLNFPRTNPTGAAALSITLKNTGERPFTLSVGALTIAPPFRLITPLPLTIQPGDSVEFDVVYEPTEKGVFSVPVLLQSGCNAELQIELNGSTDLVGTGAVMRSSKQGFNPANVEQIPCDVSRCVDLILSNVGNATLVVESMKWQLDTLGYTITTPTPIPFTVAENGQQTVQICLNSTQRGLLRDTLVIASNTRTSIAFGLVIDVSNSMNTRMDCGATNPTRLEQARIQSANFLAKTLLHLPSVGIQDQIAISRYSGTPAAPFIEHFFPLSYVDDVTRADAEARVNSTIINTVSGTQTGAAILKMIDTLRKSPLENRVLVLVTDGLATDTNLIPVSALLAAAQTNKVRVFAIGLGLSAFSNPQQRAAATNYLNLLARGTQGSAFIVEDCSSLQGAFEAITDSVSQGNIVREPFAMKITAPAVVADRGIDFDSVYYHRTGAVEQACATITLTNVGEGDAIVDSISFTDLLGGATEEFFMQPDVVMPMRIPESGQVKVPVCFTPKGLRKRSGRVYFRYNGCGARPESKDLGGTGIARANLRITDERAGLPGAIVTVPVYGDTSLAGFEVKTITYSVRWNKTMLDLRGITAGTAAGASTVSVTSPVSYQGRYGTVGITVQGADALTTPGELAQLEFMVLRGDTLATDVEVIAGNFEDGNPKALLANAGLVAFDSTCFRSYKPIHLSDDGTTKISVGEVTPNPSTRGSVSIMLRSESAARVTIGIYATDGSAVLAPVEHELTKGTNRLDFNLAGLAAGAYYLMAQTPSGETLFRTVVVH